MLKSAMVGAIALACTIASADAWVHRRTDRLHPDCNITMPCEIPMTNIGARARVARGWQAVQQTGFGRIFPLWFAAPAAQATPRPVRFYRPSGQLRYHTEPSVTISGIRALVDAAAFAAGVPARIAHAVIQQESWYDPQLRGAAGEWGIGQIKCPTARSLGFAGPCGQLADAVTNLRYSMAYLKRALDRGGAGCAGVSLYQRGLFGRVSCSSYGRQVMARAKG